MLYAFVALFLSRIWFVVHFHSAGSSGKSIHNKFLKCISPINFISFMIQFSLPLFFIREKLPITVLLKFVCYFDQHPSLVIFIYGQFCQFVLSHKEKEKNTTVSIKV